MIISGKDDNSRTNSVLYLIWSCDQLMLMQPNFSDMWKWKVKVKVTSDSLWPHGLYSPWKSPGQNTGVGSLLLLQEIFPTQGSNSGLPHGRQILYQLSHKGSPRILEWVDYPFSSKSSGPRNRTGVSCIAGRFFTNWAMRDAQSSHYSLSTHKQNSIDLS